MIRFMTAVALVLLVTACDPLETGDPPTISSYTATAVGERQIELTWGADAIADDLYATEELKVGVWVATTEDGGLDTDALGDPDYLTGEGALSYSVVGLDPATEYEVLARVFDRANVQSTNTDVKTITTLAVGKGLFGPAVETALSDVPIKLMTGRVNADVDWVGTIFGSGINWYSRKSDNTLERQSSRDLSISGLTDAYLLPVEADEYDHLFALTGSGLAYYTNADGFVKHAMSFAGTPVAGTFSYRLKDGLLDAFGYVSGSTVHLYTRVENPGTNDDPFEGRTFATNLSNPLASIALLDDDDFYDVVYFAGNEVYVALASSATGFSAAEKIGTLDSDDLGAGSYAGYLFVENGADSDKDIFVFVRNATADLTRLFSFQGNGDGTFAEKKTSDYDFATYTNPIMDVAGNLDLVPDLLVAQTASNNVAVFFGPSNTFSGTPDYFGIDGIPDEVVVGNLDSADSPPDLVIYDTSGPSLHVMIGKLNN